MDGEKKIEAWQQELIMVRSGMEEMGVYGMPALTCIVTMHPTTWEHSVFPLPLDLVEKQLVTAIEGVGINAMKTGMLGSAELVELVAATIDKYNLQNVVIDPVMVCKGCDLILVPDAAESIKKLLMPRCDIITPNTVEAAYLADMPKRTDTTNGKRETERVSSGTRKCISMARIPLSAARIAKWQPYKPTRARATPHGHPTSRQTVAMPSTFRIILCRIVPPMPYILSITKAARPPSA